MKPQNKIPLSIFKLDDKTYRVIQKTWNMTDFDKDYAYITNPFNSYVYPYRGFVDKYEHVYMPGLYSMKKKNKIITFIVNPKTKEDKQRYSKDKIISLTPDIIFTKLSDDINPVEDIPIEEGDIFAPPIKQTDDIALAGMKYCLTKKHIKFLQYKNKFKYPGMMNNAKGLLTNGNTLKMNMLSRLADIFGLNVLIAFWDKDNVSNPMNKDGKKRVYIIPDSDELDFNDPNVEFVYIERDPITGRSKL